MSVVDVALLAVSAFFVVRGLMRGLTGEIFSLAALVGSLYCSMAYSTPLARLMTEKWAVNPLIAAAAAIALLFLGVMLFCSLLGIQVKKLLKEAGFSRFDIALGGFIGVLKSTLVVLVVLVVAIIVAPLTGNAWVRNSRVLMGAAQILPAVYPPLEARGLVPNIEKLRFEAANYIVTRSLGALTGSVSPEQIEKQGGGKPSFDIMGQYPAPYTAETPDGAVSRDKSYRRRVLEYFVGPGGEWKDRDG